MGSGSKPFYLGLLVLKMVSVLFFHRCFFADVAEVQAQAQAQGQTQGQVQGQSEFKATREFASDTNIKLGVFLLGSDAGFLGSPERWFRFNRC